MTHNAHPDQLPLAARRVPHENFPVLSVAVARRHRAAFAAVYTFCRISDDLADDPTRTPEQRLEALALWRQELDRCFAGSPSLPAYTRLAEAVRAHDLPAEPFHRLLDAFEQDQRVTRYRTWSELVGYAERSANPVGELVLRIGGHSPADAAWPELIGLSDRVCTALQFVNFWQDVRRDLLGLDRIYLPLDESGINADELRAMAGVAPSAEQRDRYARILRPLVERTDALMESAAELPALADRSLARPLRLFQRAGLLVSRRIRSIGYATLWQRPRVPRLSLACMACASLLGPVRGSA